ncbi:MAG: DUF1501 domain-containing protein [Planctomycetota bacterium]
MFHHSESGESILTSRRAMLKYAGGCGLMTNTSLLATLLNLQATKSAMAQTDTSGYKALVCLFFHGGNDAYNTLTPYDGDSTSGEYGDYYQVRGGFDDGTNNPGGLALEQSTLVPISGPNSRTFGLHPGMATQVGGPSGDPTDDGVAGLYKSGKLAFVTNVGSLVEPTSRAAYNTQANLPLGLFSHADLQRHWQTGVPQTRSQVTGWGGRMADLMLSSNANDTVSMNISISGMNMFQTGGTVVPYAIGTGGATLFGGYSHDLSTLNRQNRMGTRGFDSMLGQTYADLLAKSFAEASRNSVDAAIDFNAAVNAVNLNTEFASGSPNAQLEMVARCIGARQALGQTRQIFFVSYGGWDMHTNLISGHNYRLPMVSQAMKSFNDAMVELGVDSDVTLFTASDFARTLGTNGQGSDHGWGANHMVMGGAVDGGKMYGEYPSSLLNPTSDADPSLGNLNLGRGRLIPTTSVDEYAAELAMWFGVGNNQDLEDMLPNIRNFYTTGGSTGPLDLFV